MRVLILADELFASRERALLTRLEVGLADEGVRIVHAVPESLLEHTPGGAADLSGIFSRVITYTPSTLALTRPLNVRRLLRSIEKFIGDDGIDVVHAYGGGTWPLALDLAAAFEAAVVVEIWRAGLIDRARTLRTSDAEPPVFIVCDPALERAFADHPPSGRGPGLASTVRMVPWGVLSPPAVRAGPPPGRTLSAMLIGNGRDAPAWEAALTGLAHAAQSREMLIFCDALAARRANVWAVARRLGLLDRLSLIDELEGRRDLLLAGDLLVLPEAHGEQRSVVLEAMATGMSVLASEDPVSGLLRRGETAVLAAKADAASWRRELASWMSDPEAAAALRESAHRYVRLHRRASDHVRGVLSVYEWLTSPNAIPIRQPAAAEGPIDAPNA
ncbi:MAG: hypothetical protein JNK25_02140 [Phycisphaerae bacterium]|nr:hypothetical protein [Phycisphaerae bacterium]